MIGYLIVDRHEQGRWVKRLPVLTRNEVAFEVAVHFPEDGWGNVVQSIDLDVPPAAPSIVVTPVSSD